MALVLSEAEYMAAMKHCGISKKNIGSWIKSDSADATVHILEKDNKQTFIVALRVNKKVTHDQIVGLLVHEAVHIWQEFKRRIGENNPSDEFEAYSIQSISQRLISAYSLQKAKK